VLVQAADPADDQPGSDGLPFLPDECGVPGLGDLGVGHPAAEMVVPDRPGYRMGCHASSSPGSRPCRTGLYQDWPGDPVFRPIVDQDLADGQHRNPDPVGRAEFFATA
jgi:hypothetical protein